MSGGWWEAVGWKMGELYNQVLLLSLPTDGRLDAGLVLALKGGVIGWVVDPR